MLGGDSQDHSFYHIFISFLYTGEILPFFQSSENMSSFKAASNIIFKGNINDSLDICIIFIEILSHPCIPMKADVK